MTTLPHATPTTTSTPRHLGTPPTQAGDMCDPLQTARVHVTILIDDINRISQDAANNGLLDEERYMIPPHLHDLQEADLPETQRGFIISEIAQFHN